ncbi:MAG: TlpA family protein disulfide reductase [Ignavibacteriales bacterium]|nr:TlpA family protein disulfide reductase [Ignavibacteriales bacterium]
MNRFFSVLALAVLFLIAESPAQNKKAPDFRLQTADGTTIELSKLKGKVVVLNFWATWCGPCRREIPDFIEVYGEYKSQGLEIIGIALDEEGFSLVTPFVKRFNIPYPVVIGTGKIVNAYGGFNAIPTTFVIDRNGTIVGEHTGLMTKTQLVGKLKGLL